MNFSVIASTTDTIFIAIDSLKWPAVVVFVIWLFRDDIKKLLSRLKSFGPGGGAQFSNVPSQKDAEPDFKFEQPKPRGEDGDAGLLGGHHVLGRYELSTAEWAMDSVKSDLSGRNVIASKDEKEVPIEELVTARLLWFFEFVNHRIYDGQLIALSNLRNEPEPVPNGYFHRAYLVDGRLMPAVLANYSFSDYMNWFTRMALIQFFNGGWIISSVGRDFLKYRTDQGYRIPRAASYAWGMEGP